MPFEGARVQRERITKEDTLRPTASHLDVLVATQSKVEKRPKAHPDVAAESKPASKQLHEEQSVSSDDAT